MRRGYRPQVDVYRSDDPPSLIVLVELPGVDPGEVEVVASPQALLVAGERQRPKDCGHYQQMEIDYGPFQRQVTLAEEVDPEKSTATYERGILTIRLPITPKPAQRESISIEVTTS
jgi:HSP20 family protein